MKYILLSSKEYNGNQGFDSFVEESEDLERLEHKAYELMVHDDLDFTSNPWVQIVEVGSWRIVFRSK